MLPEIIQPAELSDGKNLNAAAVGWSRRPLHMSTGLRAVGRTKRWEYWGVVTPKFLIGLTMADLNYAHLAHVYVFDREGNEETTNVKIGLGPMKHRLSDQLGPMTAVSGAIRFEDTPEGTRLLVNAPDIRIDVLAGLGGEALGVVVPWSKQRFQYTLKDLNRPATGTISVAGNSEDVTQGFAVLDRGRGIWPYSMKWNWGTGNGTVNGVQLGLQIGGKWTDGTGSTENGLFVDGRLHYWPDELMWEYDLSDSNSPWRVQGPQVEATLTPFHRRQDLTKLGIIDSRIYQAFGTWSGWASDNDGQRYKLDGLVGWAEEAHNRW